MHFAAHMHEMDRHMGGRMMDRFQDMVNDQNRRIDIARGNPQPPEAYDKPFDPLFYGNPGAAGGG